MKKIILECLLLDGISIALFILILVIATSRTVCVCVGGWMCVWGGMDMCVGGWGMDVCVRGGRGFNTYINKFLENQWTLSSCQKTSLDVQIHGLRPTHFSQPHQLCWGD